MGHHDLWLEGPEARGVLALYNQPHYSVLLAIYIKHHLPVDAMAKHHAPIVHLLPVTLADNQNYSASLQPIPCEEHHHELQQCSILSELSLNVIADERDTDFTEEEENSRTTIIKEKPNHQET